MTSAVADPAGLDLERLEPFFTNHAGPRDGGPYTATLLAGGKSNMTFSVEWGEHQLVLRRPPLGDYDPRTHDVGREFPLLTALEHEAVPTPRPIAFEPDGQLIGAPFYVMERVPGRVLADAEVAPDLADADRLGRLADALVDGLVAPHAVEPAAVGLADLGRHDGYIARQVDRWAAQWETTQQRRIPTLDEIGRRLRAAVERQAVDHVPPRPFIVHGDYHLGNVIVAPAEQFTTSPVLRAVLDWEMATLGHPLMDLGLLVTYNGPHGDHVVEVEKSVSSLPGFPSPNELVATYAAKSGRDVGDFAFFHVLAFYKVLVLTEDVRARFVAGTTVGNGYADMGRSVPMLAERVLDIADTSGIDGLRR
jgi:aminoglycoside phosphotransferase (APT) family kinase protein